MKITCITYPNGKITETMLLEQWIVQELRDEVIEAQLRINRQTLGHLYEPVRLEMEYFSDSEFIDQSFEAMTGWPLFTVERSVENSTTTTKYWLTHQRGLVYTDSESNQAEPVVFGELEPELLVCLLNAVKRIY